MSVPLFIHFDRIISTTTSSKVEKRWENAIPQDITLSSELEWNMAVFLTVVVKENFHWGTSLKPASWSGMNSTIKSRKIGTVGLWASCLPAKICRREMWSTQPNHIGNWLVYLPVSTCNIQSPCNNSREQFGCNTKPVPPSICYLTSDVLHGSEWGLA